MSFHANAIGIGLAVGGLLGLVGQGTLAFVVFLVAGILALVGF